MVVLIGGDEENFNGSLYYFDNNGYGKYINQTTCCKSEYLSTALLQYKIDVELYPNDLFYILVT